MAIYKRGKTWWTDFSVNGQRYRQSLDTSDWREAQSNEKELITQATKDKLTASSQQFSRLAFSIAAERYVETRKLELSSRSVKKEKQLLVRPTSYFQATPLNRITAEQLQSYREQRAKGGTSAAFINMEMGAIRRMLKRAKRWHLLADDLKPLRERRQVGRALTHEQKVHLQKVAASKAEWENARLAQTMALNTTMRGCEIRGLRWQDIDLIERTLVVGRATTKTDAGERVIPLNRDAMAAIVELYRRAKKKKEGAQPGHFVFPACENDNVDPTRPQTTWRTAWRRLTQAIYCPLCGQLQDPGEICSSNNCRADISKVFSPTAGLRFHDLRHHAITELAESQASDQTIMSIAGHVSQKMLAHYSHVRLDAKRKALEALSGGKPDQGYDTKNDTTDENVGAQNPQVV